MKIVILHGDDTEKSYARLTKFVEVAKKRSWEINYFDDPAIPIEDSLTSVSLFGNERFFILKNSRKISKKDYDWIKKNYTNLSGTLIFYFDSTLNSSALKNFPSDSKVEEYKLPVLIWNFLDGLVPGNCSREVQLLHRILDRQTQPVEFVFTLIIRHFRDLYWVKENASSAGFPFWKMNKLKSQASHFTSGQLKNLIQVLADIDIKVKTSNSDLAAELDLFIIKHLE